MKLMNIADEGARYKWQLYDLYDKAFPEQEKKPIQVMERLVVDGKMEMLVEEMAKKENITEELKAQDQMKWVGLMNNIKMTAEEIVATELIYQ